MPPPPFLQKKTVSEGRVNEGGTMSVHGESQSGSMSGSGSGSGNGNSSGYGTTSSNADSTPGSSIQSSLRSSSSNSASLSGSSATSSRLPAVDTRQQYPGYSFVFATDTNHSREPVYGKEPGYSVTYLKAKVGVADDSLHYFFTGFGWRNVDDLECTLSRVGVCEAWQIAFNRLIYYASYLEESSVKWAASDVQFFKDQFSAWNDLFCELDQTLGRLIHCEIANYLPKFQSSIPLPELTNPHNSTNAETPLSLLSSTFLCAAKEIFGKFRRETETPCENLNMIGGNVEGWEPCTGYSVVHATSWNK